MTTPAAPGASPWRRSGVAALAIAYAFGSLAVLLEREPRVTSYFAASPAYSVAGLAAGLGLLAVGSALTVAADRSGLGWLSVLLGVVWLAPLWAGWESGPPLVRSVAAMAAPLLVPLLVHVAMLGPLGPLKGWARRCVLAAYALFGAAVLVRALVHDPQRDRYCWVACGQDANVFLLRLDMDLARVLGNGMLWLAILGALIVVPVTIRRVFVAGRGRWAVVGVVGPAMLALVGEAAYAVTLLRDPMERFDAALGVVLFLLRSLALVGLVCGLGWVGGRARATRMRLAALVRDLGESPGPGQLEAYLAQSLRDADLAVHYWSSRTGRYVDGAGRPVVADDDGRATTRVVRGAEPVAVVRHDQSRVSRSTLENAIGSAARLFLDNERLRAEWLRQVDQLRESRSRIAASGDEHRRHLERDLHDGAQQRLLAATYELRLARAEAEAAGDRERATQLDAAVEQAVAALTELRGFAHGVFPAVLDEAGLVEALWSLSDTAKFPVELDCRLETRRDPGAERAAYLVVRAAVEAEPVIGGELLVRVVEEGGSLVVEVTGVGDVDAVHLADRVGAVGGSLEVGEARMRAVIP